MSSLKRFITRIEFTHDVSGIVTALQELSVIEMQQIRDSVFTTRNYMSVLLDIFIDVRTNYERLVTKKLKTAPPRPTTALILLSQNARFSDTNISQVFNDFITEVEKYPKADLILVGKVAVQLAYQHGLDQTHTLKEVAIPDRVKSVTDFSELLSLLTAYQQLFVFHGSFKNLVTQETLAKELSGRTTLLEVDEQVEREKRNFLYEPEIERIIEYFEQEVKKGLLLQASSESRLAHLGSRIQNLELSRTSIDEELKKLDGQYRRQHRHAQAKKQQQRLAGRSLWM